MALSNINRQQQIFRAIVREYIETAEPIGSQTIAKKYGLGVSPATVRSDMADLEDLGYLIQPHISAGRIPTELGYRFYVSTCMKPMQISASELRQLETSFEKMLNDGILGMKDLASLLANFSNSAVLFSFGGVVAITGTARIFNQPEAREQNLVVALSGIVDDLDAAANEFQKRMLADLEIFIGVDNPFDKALATVGAKFKNDDDGDFISIIGPQRMDYDLDIALLNKLKDLFENNN